MQINNKLVLIIITTLILASFHYIETVSSQGLGVAPASIDIPDGLKAKTYLRSIRLFNDGEQPVTYQLNTTGDIKTWTTFYNNINLTEPIQNISVYGKEEVIIQFTIPENTANGIYNGTIYAKITSENPNASGGAVNLIFPVDISISVIGTQILTGKVSNININDVEIGQPLFIELRFLNTGNVIATPVVNAVIIRVDEGAIDNFTYSDNSVNINSYDLLSVTWNTTNQKIGNYTAYTTVLLDETIIFEQNLSFKILPLGALTPKGEIVNLSYLGKPSKEEVLILKANYKNTGQVNTVTKFIAEVYRNGKLIEILESPEGTEELPIVKINESYNFSVYLKIIDSGSYEIQAYVVLNENNKTAIQSLFFDVVGLLDNIIIMIISIIILILVVGIIFILMKKGKIKKRSKKKNKHEKIKPKKEQKIKEPKSKVQKTKEHETIKQKIDKIISEESLVEKSKPEKPETEETKP